MKVNKILPTHCILPLRHTAGCLCLAGSAPSASQRQEAQVIFWNSFRPLISFIRFLSFVPLAVLLRSHTQLWRLIRTLHTDVDAGDLSELTPRKRSFMCENSSGGEVLRTGDVERERRGALSRNTFANSQVIRPVTGIDRAAYQPAAETLWSF